MQNSQKKIVLIGGPGTGKSTVLKTLKKEGFHCYDEISREVTLKAQKDGIEQLFLEEPILFSKLLLEGRENQYDSAENSDANIVFFDRGIPDIPAYMDYVETQYPTYFLEKSKKYKYDMIFHFAPWKEIYTSDNERYESFSDAKKIDGFLVRTYKNLGYTPIKVPFDTVANRVNFIKEFLSL